MMLVLTSTPEPLSGSRRLKVGVSWDAVRAYNAGFKDPAPAARRYEYAKKIHYYYTAIKVANELLKRSEKSP